MATYNYANQTFTFDLGPFGTYEGGTEVVDGGGTGTGTGNEAGGGAGNGAGGGANDIESTVQNSIFRGISAVDTWKSVSDIRSIAKNKRTAEQTKALHKANAGAIGQGLALVGDIGNMFMPEKSEYSGDKGEITKTADEIYDGISDTLMQFGPWGQFAGGIMKGASFVGNGLNAIGMGTDGMTTTDAILGSSFFNMTPVGMINGAFGKTADTITKDNEVFAQVGGSYSGTNNKVDEAVNYSGKKYGLFSSGARKKANKKIAEAKRQQSIVSDISDEAQDRANITNSMSGYASTRYAYDLQGGYDQAGIRAARHGMILSRTRRIVRKAQNGSVLGDLLTYGNKNTLTSDAEKKMKEQASKAKKQQKAVTSMFDSKTNDANRFQQKYLGDLSSIFHDVNANQFSGDAIQPDVEMLKQGNDIRKRAKSITSKSLGKYQSGGGFENFFSTYKAITNPTANVKNLSSKDTYDWDKIFGNNVIIDSVAIDDNEDTSTSTGSEEENQTKTQKKGGMLNYSNVQPVRLHDEPVVNGFKQGGSIASRTSISPVNASLLEDDDIEEFRQGGEINVIPEGALHARLHNIEMDDITKKGIPVVDNDDVQQAEIERAEIIYRLDVTKELERLCKIYDDKDSSQKEKDQAALEAGKLLVKETLYNTQDNTNELL